MLHADVLRTLIGFAIAMPLLGSTSAAAVPAKVRFNQHVRPILRRQRGHAQIGANCAAIEKVENGSVSVTFRRPALDFPLDTPFEAALSYGDRSLTEPSLFPSLVVLPALPASAERPSAPAMTLMAWARQRA